MNLLMVSPTLRQYHFNAVFLQKSPKKVLKKSDKSLPKVLKKSTKSPIFCPHSYSCKSISPKVWYS